MSMMFDGYLWLFSDCVMIVECDDQKACFYTTTTEILWLALRANDTRALEHQTDIVTTYIISKGGIRDTDMISSPNFSNAETFRACISTKIPLLESDALSTTSSAMP